MRAAAILLIALLAVPLVEAGPLKFLASHSSNSPGWFAQSFVLDNSTEVWVAVGDDSSGEIVGHVLALYDGAGNLIRGTTFFSIGGQIVEVAAGAQGHRIDNAGTPGLVSAGYFERTIGWSCDAACNPSRQFTLVATAGGDLDWWGTAIYTRGGNKTAHTSGTEAYALTTREFSGTVAHVATPFGGVHVARDASHVAQADDRMLVTFVKPSTTPPTMMRMSAGGADVACPCFGEYLAGERVFRYEDVDRRGIDAFLTYADVRLP